MKSRISGLAVVAVASILVSCQPSDPADDRVEVCDPADVTSCEQVPRKNVAQMLRLGKVVSFTHSGFRFAGCHERRMDWKDLRLSGEQERHRIITGVQGSYVQPGYSTCFRVGTQVALVTRENQTRPGLVLITRISWVRWEALTKELLQGSHLRSESEFQRLKSNLKSRLRPQHRGIVTIVDFTYIGSSAADEKAIRERLNPKEPDYEEVTTPGSYLSGVTCRSPWQDTYIPEMWHPAIQSGQLRSWYRYGVRPCFQAGQLLELRAGRDQPVFAKVRIDKVKRFRAEFLSAEFFQYSGFEITALLDEITRRNTRSEPYVSVIDFHRVDEGLAPQTE